MSQRAQLVLNGAAGTWFCATWERHGCRANRKSASRNDQLTRASASLNASLAGSGLAAIWILLAFRKGESSLLRVDTVTATSCYSKWIDLLTVTDQNGSFPAMVSAGEQDYQMIGRPRASSGNTIARLLRLFRTASKADPTMTL
jgi:hypothetical protein